MLRKLLVAAAAALGLTAAAANADAAVTLKIGTLAPAGSPWAAAFNKIAADVQQNSGGEVILDFRFSYGDEIRMVGDIRSGQLDGAAITALGLGQIYKDILIFQLPGLFNTWPKLEHARSKMRPQLEAEFSKQGFTILGWGDVGAAKIMSNGFDVKTPNDVQGKGTYLVAGDPVGPVFFQRLGGVTPKQISITEILPGLNNGTINVILAPAIAAEQLQWSSKITHINTMTIGFGIGALVVSTAKFNQIPSEKRTSFSGKGDAAGDALSKSVRHADAQAFARLKSRKVAYDPSDADRAQWHKFFEDVRSQVRGSVFTPAFYDQVVALAK